LSGEIEINKRQRGCGKLTHQSTTEALSQNDHWHSFYHHKKILSGQKVATWPWEVDGLRTKAPLKHCRKTITGIPFTITKKSCQIKKWQRGHGKLMVYAPKHH